MGPKRKDKTDGTRQTVLAFAAKPAGTEKRPIEVDGESGNDNPVVVKKSKTVKTIDPDVKSDTFQRDRAGSLSIQDGADAAPSSSKLGMVSRSSKDDAEDSPVPIVAKDEFRKDKGKGKSVGKQDSDGDKGDLEKRQGATEALGNTLVKAAQGKPVDSNNDAALKCNVLYVTSLMKLVKVGEDLVKGQDEIIRRLDGKNSHP